jgi:thiopurine S-methyltransferase
VEHEFWHNAWEKEKQGWQQSTANTHLQSFWKEFDQGEQNSKVFVPLCGQSLDMLWLLEQGHSVIGVELNRGSIERFYHQHQIPHQVSECGTFTTFDADQLSILTGDFFDLEAKHLDGVSLIYDRAALIALPPDMRVDYAQKIKDITVRGQRIFLISMEYNISEMSGPPFSVSDEEIYNLFSANFEIEKRISSSDPALLGGLVKRGLTALTENVFFLSRI